MSNSVSTRTFGGESFGFRPYFDALAREIPCSEILLLTTLPTGGLRVIQPQKVSDNLAKAYAAQWQSHDYASWKAISTGEPARGKTTTPFTDDFLKPNGFEYYLSAPVSEPILAGYPGVLMLLRSAEQGAFSQQDIEHLQNSAAQLSRSLRETRMNRTVIQESAASDSQPTDIRQFVLDENGEPLLFEKAFGHLDENIRRQLAREATVRAQKITGEQPELQRLTLPDSHGDHWVVNAVTYASFPALHGGANGGAHGGAHGGTHDGPVVFFCLIPGCLDWAMLRPTDFQADGEIARLVPAMKFMQQDFRRGPTLTEISRTVHLSPFHFHRRFSELFGLTPKHFLLECQIHSAKSELLSGEKELSRIASECGFAHQSHFTSRFKQATGLTPTRWRRMANARNR